MSFKEIFKKADQFAEQFGQKISDEQLQELILICMPYFMYLRKSFCFFRIPIEDIKKEIAPSSINQAFLIQQRRKIPFSLCLQNAFRDCCRKQMRLLREHDADNIAIRCYIEKSQKLLDNSIGYPSPEVKAQENDLVELVDNILKKHSRFSKQVVYQKTRGSTYPEMADIFKTALNECKRIYWHDIYHIREKLNHNPKEKQKRI